jgi:transposase
LTRSGRSHGSAARELGLNRRTVSKYARARTWQEVVRRPPRKFSTLDPYLDYLQQRWDEGQHSAKILSEELQSKGYLGHYQRVKMAVAPLRRGLPVDHCPELRTAHDLVRRFAAMLDNRDATSLPEWLDDLANTGLAPLTGLARSLSEDRAAVTQGITTPYNSGVNEGRITDVKLQKRIMAGRAGVRLLRHRVVLIANRRRYADRPTISPR